MAVYKYTYRRGLQESFETYAASNPNLDAYRARVAWQHEGLRLLGCEGMVTGGARIAPGVAVPVRFNGRTLTPADVIEREDEPV